MRLDPDALALALAAYPREHHAALPGRTNHVAAGVLVPLVWREDGGVDVILTLRSPRLRHHAGEVSFPGGRPEAGDADLLATALREAVEEVGARPLRVFGRLSSFPVFTSDHRLEPFVAAVEPELTPSPGEVAAILPVSLDDLLGAEQIEAIAWEQDGHTHLSPVWDVGGTLVFGGTAHVLLELLRVVAPVAAVDVPPLVPAPFAWSGTHVVRVAG